MPIVFVDYQIPSIYGNISTLSEFIKSNVYEKLIQEIKKFKLTLKLNHNYPNNRINPTTNAIIEIPIVT